MTFTCDELKGLENPYQKLNNGDALAEHQEELNKLNPEEMKTLATLIIFQCPQENMWDLAHAIEALREPANVLQTFHSVINQAFEVKKRILSLLDPRNKHPHLMILESEFNKALFNNFNDLALKVLDTNETIIAGRLAETTPEDQRSLVARNITTFFPESLFATKVGQAFAIRRDIDRFLLGTEPHLFFSSPEYSLDSVFEFPELIVMAVKDKELNIAIQLAQTTPVEMRSQIASCVNSICPDQSILGPKIRAAFALRREIDLYLLGDKPEQFFNSREFSVDNCLEFSKLFPVLLKDHEQEIGHKLSRITDPKVRSEIGRKLEWINSAAHDQTSPFRLIAGAMANEQSMKPKSHEQSSAPTSSSSDASSSQSAGLHFNSIFSELRNRNTGNPNNSLIRMDFDDEEKPVKSWNCCGLF